MKKKIFEFWKANYIDMLIIVGLLFIVVPTFVVNIIIGYYLLGVISTGFGVLFLKIKGGEK